MRPVELTVELSSTETFKATAEFPCKIVIDPADKANSFKKNDLYIKKAKSDYRLRFKLISSNLFQLQDWHMELNASCSPRGLHSLVAGLRLAEAKHAGRAGSRIAPDLKENQWYFGMKVHIGIDAERGLIHSIHTTSENVHDFTSDLACSMVGR